MQVKLHLERPVRHSAAPPQEVENLFEHRIKFHH
jgi:hypothetical protein